MFGITLFDTQPRSRKLADELEAKKRRAYEPFQDPLDSASDFWPD